MNSLAELWNIPLTWKYFVRSIWCISISFCAKQLKIHSKCKLSVKKISWKQQLYIRSTKELISRSFSFGERECLVFPRRCVHFTLKLHMEILSHTFLTKILWKYCFCYRGYQRVDFTRISRFSTLYCAFHNEAAI